MKSRTSKSRPRRRLSGPIHDRIASLRDKRDLTQQQLAELVGVDKTAVSHWENGIARPDLSRLPALADALGVSLDDLLEGEVAA